MLKYGSQVEIDRPPADVFRYLVEPAKQALWSDVPMTQLTEGEMRTGSRFEVSFGKGPLKATLGIELAEVVPGTLMAWKSYSGPIDWQGEYRLEAIDGGGTRLSQAGNLEFHGMWRLLEPMAGREIESGEIKELEKLKSIAEAARD